MADTTEKPHSGHHDDERGVVTTSNGMRMDLPTSPEDLDEVNFRKILWKMDIRIVPVVTVLYLLSFLDRGYVDHRD